MLLAAVAGGMRTYLIRRGEQPVALKAMVPVSVRSSEDVLGNHISFVFAELPCDEPDPLGRLYQVHATMSARKRDGEPEGADLALKAAEHTPGVVQHAISGSSRAPARSTSSSRTSPARHVPLYMLGCPLQAIYPVVPLADRHAVSVGMTTVGDRACFGVYADREALPDAEHARPRHRRRDHRAARRHPPAVSQSVVGRRREDGRLKRLSSTSRPARATGSCGSTSRARRIRSRV